MITIAWYLFKVIICSGILYGYYYVGLRNKIFHRWNRFYLLASIVLALMMPLMKINIFQKSEADKGTVVRILQTINNSDEIIIEYSKNRGIQFNAENIIVTGYVLVTIVFIYFFFIGLNKISGLRKKYPRTTFGGINFISTNAKGTPFSFFNSIFWNDAIDLYSRQGQQIFHHEIAHIKEKHSYDKIFMNVVLLFFWINPFFWLMQKELGIIHEFIADKEAIEDNDTNAFAEMILQTVYPEQYFFITNNFFHSPLKRRLIMLTKNKNPEITYISRLLVLPLAAIVFFAFTLKMKTIKTLNNYTGKKITVVIDAGHGGSDNGVIENNISEKDLTLSIAKDIKEMNKNENLDIILSRADDKLLTPQERIKFAEASKADLFVSIHTDAEANKNANSGLYIFIPKNDNSYLEKSKILGTSIIQSFINNYQLNVANDLQQREKGVWILKANQFPSVLIEAGFLTTQKDFNYLTNPENQQTIARNILNGIEKYAQLNIGSSTNETSVYDTIPSKYYKNKEIKSVLISDKEDSVYITYNDGKKETITKEESDKRGLLLPPPPPAPPIPNVPPPNVPPAPQPPPPPSQKLTQNALYILDGDVTSYNKIKTINSGNIERINVTTGEKAIKLYGEKGKNGVVEIFMKTGIIDKNVTPRDNPINNSSDFLSSDNTIKNNSGADTIPDKIFTKVENEAEFPGGKEAWLKYIVGQIQKNQNDFSNKDYGTCLVKFIVNTDGSVSQVEATTMKDTQLAKVAISAIRSGPKWLPATQNNHIVAAYRLQPITLTQPK
ncbi:MAG: N-acetylmuramoyl-L-alanine amidase [Ginsengibacter sp.]